MRNVPLLTSVKMRMLNVLVEPVDVSALTSIRILSVVR